ncbi:PAS domain-containing protein [Pontiella sulfatireligans]|uniref:Uncharacterized protein n=1 Tax=Pontiella sulfatireligans TaxID=2750658 RepID=A0A6C2UNT4_9BACT|nr:PAS domain-containing protein [Pontiella sulfatireligans]VGO20931.1 hypothetical protein SCARR_02998 [Pontiella sulfatireligans]
MKLHNRFSKIESTATALAGMLLVPSGVQAQGGNELASLLPFELSIASYLIIGGLLVLSMIMFFSFQRRFNVASRQLKDITNELDGTRTRLVETGHDLTQTRGELKHTAERYQGILFDAKVGMFQMDAAGKCTYINAALQEMSGLYPKKAIKEGLHSAIHPEDREAFKSAWGQFTNSQEPLKFAFRFKPAKKPEVHVVCQATKVFNEKMDVESCIGWIYDVTEQHEEKLSLKANAARYARFVEETIEGYYQLTPATPIPLSTSPEKMTQAIMSEMTVASCNNTFSGMYGTKPTELEGKSISELQDGCGPFRNYESIATFVAEGFKAVDLESVRQDASGSRINLLNNVIGLIEDNKLVGIWGSQRNISQQKREKAELGSQVQFMHRILSALPADVHVKDTRCRYLYASKRLAERTGIPQEEWVGKTIFEIMPATPREHDQQAINTMKSSKLHRIERPYETRNKSGWMETIQIPLVSDEGLVEGVVGLSLEITDRKQKEEEARHYRGELESQIKNTANQLRKSQGEHSKTASSLSSAIQKLKILEAEKINREHEYKEHLADRKRIEETLRRGEEALQARQRQLEEQLSKRLEKLNAETDKRKKWEELLSIKEKELRKLDEHSKNLKKQFDEATALHQQAEANLKLNRSALDKYRIELEELTAERNQQLDAVKSQHEQQFNTEHQGRDKAEKQLQKVDDLLHKTQEQLKQLTEKHSDELQKEVAERKATAEKLIQNMEELDELKQQFSLRIEQETKAMKQQLAQKQIREKALRQREKDLEDRIKELENSLHLKAKEHADQIQAREGSEVQRQQAEQKLELMSKRQTQLIERETQKLNLNVAEIRLDEIKLRKRVSDLMQEKEMLEDYLKARNDELEAAHEAHREASAALAETQGKLKELAEGQSQMVASETQELQRQLEEQRQIGEQLHQETESLKQEQGAANEQLKTRAAELSRMAAEYKKLAEAYKSGQAKIQQMADNQAQLLADETSELQNKMALLQQSENSLCEQEKKQEERIAKLEEQIASATESLRAEEQKHKQGEQELAELQIAFEASQENAESFVEQQTDELRKQNEQYQKNETALQQSVTALQETIEQRERELTETFQQRETAEEQMQQAENLLNKLKLEQQAELRKALAEAEAISRMNGELVDELNRTIQETLDPAIKSSLVIEQAENLSPQQKAEITGINFRCRNLIDMMNYRSELTHLVDGSGEVNADECDLHELIKNIDQQFTHRAETKKLFFAVSFAQYQAAHNVPKLVKTDEQKVRKILSILLGYALDHTEKGRLGLHAARKSSEGDGTRILFEMVYTGTNRHDPLLSKLFGTPDEPAVEGAVDNKFGLTLARRYATLLDAEINLEYRDAGVTALAVEFPFKKAASEITMPEKQKEAGAA